ncbi:YgaP family membrane protein [Roseateles sp. NT4]|uniref:YgaP family membrane protein n=1 Tax=Roseateles sp. NT4 TaxID=3453715 RepID=UPI003EEE9C11
MFYVKNIPTGERIVRVVCGIAAAGAGLALLGGTTGWLVAAGAVGLVASGLFGFCPACAMVGRKLK